MEVLKEKYTITELSERLNVTDHALRYYEKEFSLAVPKDSRGRRYYTPELANIMYQIKTMRDDGLEIKAIKKILISENMINPPPPVVLEGTSSSLVPVDYGYASNEIKQFFNEFKDEITSSISCELTAAKEHLSKEINKSKLELGACMENSIRKLETKMEKHFIEVDRSIGEWREKNRAGFFKRWVKRVLK
ncbi:MAG: MerR family transcriptional regulator [Clostridiales bacterium]|nr:MerR family transcriptional regulator [Eubacteriales bacterium]MDH7565218.1 MerR family transcriptional regulator [Clostridiales bacterium]